MAAAVELNVARKKLVEALGDDSKTYFSHLKLWFRQKMSKEEFDCESRKMLSSEAVHLHNEFLLAILNKCQSLTSHVSKESSNTSHNLTKDKLKKGKTKRKSRPVRANFEHRFQPVNPLHYAVPVVSTIRDGDSTQLPSHAVNHNSSSTPTVSNEGRKITFCGREVVLPDPAMVHGRMYVTAWDCGLDDVSEDAVRMVVVAVQHHLKDILMAIFRRRSAYKLRENKFVYALGTTLPDPYRISTRQVHDHMSESYATEVTLSGEHVPSMKPPWERAEAEAAFSVACAPVETPTKAPVSLYDLLEALQMHRGVVASHSVYAINMERIMSRLWHPSHEELEQQQLHYQEQIALRKLSGKSWQRS